jgi:hypothetical protein
MFTIKDKTYSTGSVFDMYDNNFRNINKLAKRIFIMPTFIGILDTYCMQQPFDFSDQKSEQ